MSAFFSYHLNRTRELCRRKGLSSSGTYEEMMDRLIQHQREENIKAGLMDRDGNWIEK